MSIYISPQNEYPRFQGDIKLSHPEWSVGQELPEGWVEVLESTIPTANENEVVEELAPVQKNNQWFRNWQVRPLTEQEKSRRDAPKTAKAKLLALGLTDVEIEALRIGMVR